MGTDRSDDPEPGNAIAFERVRVSLGGHPALNGISFELGVGETLVLLGRSGSGKSTTLRLVNALLRPDAGTVRVEGVPTDRWDPIRLRLGIGYVMQDVGLFPHYTVVQNVAVVPRLLGWSEARRSERALEVLDRVGLSGKEFGARYPHELSGGQRQRVGVARALAADPAIMLCDEPFGALDPITRYTLQREFRALSRRLGKSLLFVTHDVTEALYMADRIALLERGELRFVGTPGALRASDEPTVIAFLEAARAGRPEPE